MQTNTLSNVACSEHVHTTPPVIANCRTAWDALNGVLTVWEGTAEKQQFHLGDLDKLREVVVRLEYEQNRRVAVRKQEREARAAFDRAVEARDVAHTALATAQECVDRAKQHLEEAKAAARTVLGRDA